MCNLRKPGVEMAEVYFRAVCTTDEEYPTGEDDFQIEFHEFRVIRRTKKGAWITRGLYDKERFVLDDATKRFAYPTKDQALESLIARKKRHIKILESDLAMARIALALAESLKIEPTKNGD